MSERPRERGVAHLGDQGWSAVIDALPDPVIVLEPIRDDSGAIADFSYVMANAAACSFHGRAPGGMTGASLLDLHPSAAEAGLVNAYVGILDTGEPMIVDDYSYPQELLGGEVRTYEVRAMRLDGRIVQTWRDVTERIVSRQHLAESERRYRLLAENSMDLVFSLDTHAVIDWVSPSSVRLLEYDPQELVGRFGGILIHPDDLPELLDASTAAREGGVASCRIRMVAKSGALRWVEATPRPLLDDTGALVGGVIGVRDIGDEVAAQEALEHEVAFDGLTGLAGRSLALVRIQEILDTRTETGWALLCVGIDGMTVINQGYTYAGGDAVLTEVAVRLVRVAGTADRVARIAGDEFVVILREVTTPTDAAEWAQRILDAVRGPVSIGDSGHVDVTACVGIAMSRSAGAEELLRDATAAMRQASKDGTDRWQFIGGDIQGSTRRELALKADLRRAVDGGDVEAWIMPLVRLSDGVVIGYEALARWRRSDGTILGPHEFMEVAERSPLIVSLDRAMLVQVVDLLRQLPADQHVSVNVSGVTLAQAELPTWVREAVDGAGVDPSRLHLEVTESALFRVTDSILAAMSEIAGLGVSWWVDDFGTGYSSVSHLRDLPISGLKLDQSFTEAVTEAQSSESRIAQGLAGLAHGLGLATVAEGVETQQQAQVLQEQGWQYGQGWLFGSPRPGSHVTTP